MATALPEYAAPLFCLGGTIYPVPTNFDWSSDADVLCDALRDTRVAITTHQWALRSESPAWLACECVDPRRHIDLLQAGLFALTNTMHSVIPDAAVDPKRSHRLPYLAPFLRAVNLLVIGGGVIAGYAAMTANRTKETVAVLATVL